MGIHIHRLALYQILRFLYSPTLKGTRYKCEKLLNIALPGHFGIEIVISILTIVNATEVFFQCELGCSCPLSSINRLRYIFSFLKLSTISIDEFYISSSIQI